MSNEIYYLPARLSQLLANTDDAGILKFNHPKADLGAELDRIVGKERQKTLAAYAFSLVQGWYHLNTFAQAKRLDPKVVAVADRCQVHVKLCPFFGLPGVNPKAELDEVRALLEKIRVTIFAWFERNQNSQRTLSLQIHNSCRNWIDGVEYTDTTDPVVQCDLEALIETIKTSDALTSMVKFGRRLANSIGPHSWMTISADSFYDTSFGSGHPVYIRALRARAA